MLSARERRVTVGEEPLFEPYVWRTLNTFLRRDGQPHEWRASSTGSRAELHAAVWFPFSTAERLEGSTVCARQCFRNILVPLISPGPKAARDLSI